MVFRTLQEGQDYREARLKARDNKNPPTIITLDGNRLTAKGAAGGRYTHIHTYSLFHLAPHHDTHLQGEARVSPSTALK